MADCVMRSAEPVDDRTHPAHTLKSLIALLPLLFAAALMGCGQTEQANDISATTALDSTSPSTSLRAPEVTADSVGHDTTGALEEADCPDNGSCPVGFLLDGDFYLLECTSVREDFVLPELIAEGTVAGRSLSVHGIDGVASHTLMAVAGANGGCFEDNPNSATEPWSLALRQGTDPQEWLEVFCQVAIPSETERNANGCP